MLTDKTIRSLKPKINPYRVFDKRREGLYVQVSTGGQRTFYLKYRFNAVYRFLNLGRYPAISLKRARHEASLAREQVRRGFDPKTQREEQRQDYIRKIAEGERQKIEAANTGSVEDLFNVYIKRLEAEGKSKQHIVEVRRAYTSDIKPVLGTETRARDIAPTHIKAVLRTLIERGSLVQANRTRSYLHAAFKSGIEFDNDSCNLSDLRFRLERNPVADVPRPLKRESPRDRDLSGEEIYLFWRALTVSGCSIYVKTGLKLLFATGGQRITEVMGAKWSEFDFERALWELPRERAKNKHPHVVPLERVAVSLFKRLPRISEYVFPSHKGGHMTDQALARAVYRLRAKMKIKTFTPMDIRRTVKSRMGELGISKEIRDRLHNHALGDVSSKHYDRYEYLPEKRVAMVRWDQYLKDLLKHHT